MCRYFYWSMRRNEGDKSARSRTEKKLQCHCSIPLSPVRPHVRHYFNTLAGTASKFLLRKIINFINLFCVSCTCACLCVCIEARKMILGALIYHSLSYSFETGFFTEVGSRLVARVPQWSYCIHPLQLWGYRLVNKMTPSTSDTFKIWTQILMLYTERFYTLSYLSFVPQVPLLYRLLWAELLPFQGRREATRWGIVRV